MAISRDLWRSTLNPHWARAEPGLLCSTSEVGSGRCDDRAWLDTLFMPWWQVHIHWVYRGRRTDTPLAYVCFLACLSLSSHRLPCINSSESSYLSSYVTSRVYVQYTILPLSTRDMCEIHTSFDQNAVQYSCFMNTLTLQGACHAPPPPKRNNFIRSFKQWYSGRHSIMKPS